MVRLVVLVILELALVAFLAAQLVATPDAGDAPPEAPVDEQPDSPPARPLPAAVDTVADSGLVPGTTPAAAQRDEAIVPFRQDDPVGVLLSGTVRWSDGTPIEEPSLHLRRDGQGRSAATGKDGSFVVVGLAPGEWEATVRAAGAADGTETIPLTDAAVQQHDFTLDRSFPVRVRIVTPDGADGTTALRKAQMYGFELHVVGRRERFPPRLAPTDYGAVIAGDAKWNGEMNPKDGNAGTLHFASTPPAHAALLLRHVVVDQQLVQPGQEEVTFTITVDALQALTGSVTLRLLDEATGAPLAKARVALNSSNRGGGGKEVDADGRATLVGLPPGLLRLEIYATDHEQPFRMVEIQPGQQLDLGDLRLGAALPLSGRVFDTDGKPCAAAMLSWTSLAWRSEGTKFVGNRFTRSEADGTWQLAGTGRGRIAVRARDENGNVALGVFDNPPAAPIELRLVPAAKLIVRRPDDPTKAYTVTLYDGQRRALAAETLEPRSREATITAPPGSYAFEVHDETGRAVQSGSVMLSGEPATLEIR